MRKILFAAAAAATLSLALTASAQPPRPAAPAPGAMPAAVWSVGGKDAEWFADRPGRADPDSEPVAPFKLIGDVYYVGAANISSILIGTKAGHILIDTGTTKMAAVVFPGMVKLGFHPADLKVLLVSHAHFDHVQTVETHRRISGAKMFALDAEAPALASGHDRSAIESEGFEPIRIDRIMKNGEEFTLGGVKVKVIWTPGHTPGTATYVITGVENGRPYTVVFGGPPQPVAGNPNYNTDPASVETAYRMLREVNPDIVIGGHPENAFKGKLAALQAGTRPSPLAMAPGAWAKMIDDSEAGYKRRLAASMTVGPAPAAPAAR